MAAVLTENLVDVRPRRAQPVVIEDEIAIDLGVWLSGLESFLAAGHHSFTGVRSGGGVPDSSKEFRLVHAALQRCSMLNALLLSGHGGAALGARLKYDDLKSLAPELRDVTLLSDALIHSPSLHTGEWKAWSSMLSQRFRSLPAFAKIIRLAEEEGEKYLPEPLKNLAEKTRGLTEEMAELTLVLPRFAKILKWLSVIGRMLAADEPLKPALLIFSRVNEQILELTVYINGRLERFPNEEVELFGSLDAASYTASIELKKVYSQELAGLAGVRPSPSIYARMETAHSLLSEGFQQILAGFARVVEPEANVFDLFPNFGVKREQSLALRSALWEMTRVVQAAEKNPERTRIDELHKTLREFSKSTVRFLFYKDTETVERFVEEILVTQDNKDLVPILHRFGAYLETLFGQVNMRAVLAKHPFQDN